MPFLRLGGIGMGQILGALLMLIGAIFGICGIAFFSYIERYSMVGSGSLGLIFGFLLWEVGACREKLSKLEKQLFSKKSVSDHTQKDTDI